MGDFSFIQLSKTRDDEFEAEAQILFDKKLTDVFNIKDLAILGDVLMIALKTFTFSLDSKKN